MGFGRGFTFILGSLCGVYVAQHYRVPRIGDWVHSGCVKARELEQAYRRPNNEAHRARELEQAYRRPDNINSNEGHRARDCWFRAKYRPENFYGNEAGEEQNNEVVNPSLSKHMDLNNEELYNNKVLKEDWTRPMDPNEVREKQNNVVHPRWVRPRDLINKPYNNNGPDNFNPNERGQE